MDTLVDNGDHRNAHSSQSNFNYNYLRANDIRQCYSNLSTVLTVFGSISDGQGARKALL